MEKKTVFESTQEFFDQWMKIYEATYGGLLKMPAIGPARKKQEKMMKNFPVYANLYTSLIDSNINFQTVLTEAMIKTCEKTVGGTERGLTPEKSKEFYQIWIDTYSDTFKEFIKSGHFSSDMEKLMSNFISFQQNNKEMLEENFLKPMNLPTKTDIDEINKEIYFLRKTVREMTIQVKELSEKLDKSEKELSEKLDKSEKELSEKLDKSEKGLSEKLDKSEKGLSEKLDKSEKGFSEKLDKSKKEINKFEINKTEKDKYKKEKDETI